MRKSPVISCPYCGEKFDYWFVFNVKEKDEVMCNKCKKILCVKLTKRVYKLAWIIEIVALIIALIACIVLKGFWVVLSALLIECLFIFFHLQVPFETKLTKKANKSTPFANTDMKKMKDRQRINFIEPIDDQ